MDMTAIVDAMLDVAKAAAPLVGHGAPEAITLGQRVVEMIDHATEELQGSVDNGTLSGLASERDKLEARVNAHVDATEKALRGG